MSGSESLGVEMWRKRRLELRVGNWVNANENHYEIPSHTHCCCSVTQFFLTFCDPMDCSTPGFPVLHYLPEFAQTHVHWVGDAIQSSHSQLPLLLLLLLQYCPASGSFPMSWLFVSSGQSIRTSASASNEYSGLISFIIDWLDLLAVQGTLKSLLQHHSSKVLILWHSAFFMVQLSHCTWVLEKP